MFCYQCEQSAKGTGCTVKGVCGKDEGVSFLQDELIASIKGISWYASRAAALGKNDNAADLFVTEALFSTLTNVNFDASRIEGLLKKAEDIKAKAKAMYEAACKETGKTPESVGEPAEWSIIVRREKYGEDISSLQELLTYGLKGIAAYADHAHILGQEDKEVFKFMHDALSYLTKKDQTVPELFDMCLKAGAANLRAMELLDGANTGTYGHPAPTAVRVTPVKGKAIVVSGHDLKDLEELLKQTEGKGINVYTHGEMLPAHGYPELKKYAHLVGNYGGAWQDQVKEFDAFPGAVVMTTNCIQKPKESYQGRIFSTGLVAMPGVTHVTNADFSPAIEAALNAPGFSEDASEKTVLVGFGRNTVMSVADKVIGAVKAGQIKHFFLIGGCDGAKSGRSYYTELAEAVPKDCVILTLACGKYRFNKLEFGDIGGIPRLLDIGQCNDAYSAIKIAVALAGAFECGVNDLPLSMVLSWYEQKAVSILLTLLHLGIKNIRIGPSLPAFLSPNVVSVLVDKFNIMPITTPEADLKAMLG
ncbi:MAG: hydroxylamine reductase [Nitrospirota bacterium]